MKEFFQNNKKLVIGVGVAILVVVISAVAGVSVDDILRWVGIISDATGGGNN